MRLDSSCEIIKVRLRGGEKRGNTEKRGASWGSFMTGRETENLNMRGWVGYIEIPNELTNGGYRT